MKKISQFNATQVDKQTLKNEILQDITPCLTSYSDDNILRVIREERLKEMKKNNLCIRGFPLPTEGAVGDLEAFKQLCMNQLSLNHHIVQNISSCRRLANAANSQAPIMITCCANLSSKREILRNAYKLRDYKSRLNMPVYIAPDLTVEEVKRSIELRKELSLRRSRGETVTIKKNKIVAINIPTDAPLTRARAAQL